jgi:hypothetical protein
VNETNTKSRLVLITPKLFQNDRTVGELEIYCLLVRSRKNELTSGLFPLKNAQQQEGYDSLAH